MPTRILLKTTIGPVADDWHIGRFSLLANHLRAIKDRSGRYAYDVVTLDRNENARGADIDLAHLAEGAYDQLWLFATDVTGALTSDDVKHIMRFRRRGGGALLTRDHQDLGACLARLGVPGSTQYFQTVNPDPEVAHRCCDDLDTPSISWPNYHSGANGDLQRVTATDPVHPLMKRASGESLQFIPAHPHEGAVGVPSAIQNIARVVAHGRSSTTGATFALCVAVEEPGMGRIVSDSSFHHFCDYNWDPRIGAPSFVSEPPGKGVLALRSALDDTHRYVENIAAWLADERSH